jgi:membrane protease YdiL (CAAX protease family)
MSDDSASEHEPVQEFASEFGDETEAEIAPLMRAREPDAVQTEFEFGTRFPQARLPYVYSVPAAPVHRTPNLGDAAIFLTFLLIGALVTIGVVGVALYFHWFGLQSFAQAQNNSRLALGTQFLLYAIGLAAAVPFFGMVWGKGFFDGLHWHGATAFRLRYRLVATAFVCNGIAMLGNWLLPFPEHAPIDKMFGSTADAWLLMAFGVVVAPFFEEMIFRGFLLPAMATAWDWSIERSTGRSPRPLDADGNPAWSGSAMIFAALTVSVPFALLHAEQVAKAWGPLLLLYCVSLILCAVRLATRSLAASTLVHSAYNFMLFALMFAQTGGFRHLDKM